MSGTAFGVSGVSEVWLTVGVEDGWDSNMVAVALLCDGEVRLTDIVDSAFEIFLCGEVCFLCPIKKGHLHTLV